MVCSLYKICQQGIVMSFREDDSAEAVLDLFPELCFERFYTAKGLHRQECPEITYMAMGFRPHWFRVGGMYMKGTGRLTKVEKNRSLLFSITS